MLHFADGESKGDLRETESGGFGKDLSEDAVGQCLSEGLAFDGIRGMCSDFCLGLHSSKKPFCSRLRSPGTAVAVKQCSTHDCTTPHNSYL